MNNIKLACTVPLAAAVNAKRPIYGDCSVKLSNLDGLSPGALALLASASDLWNDKKDGLLVVVANTRQRLIITEETELAAIEALEALAAKIAAENEKIRAEAEELARKRAKAKAEMEAIMAIDSAYATDDSINRAKDVIGYFSGKDELPLRGWLAVAEATRACDRLMAANAAVLALDPASPEADAAELEYVFGAKIKGDDGKRNWPAPRAEAMARLDKWLADRAAAREAREAARKDAILAYVRAHAPEWRRAADDGRDVEGVGAKHAAEAVEEAVEGALGSELVPGWTDIKPRDVPTSRAYESMDSLRDVVAKVIEALPCELRALCDEPTYEIVRLETQEADEENETSAVYVTAALAKIGVAGRTVRVARRAE